MKMGWGERMGREEMGREGMGRDGFKASHKP
jgi:hypothetical protein